jgi:hypothetical protein
LLKRSIRWKIAVFDVGEIGRKNFLKDPDSE